jgi:hypothetical protein
MLPDWPAGKLPIAAGSEESTPEGQRNALKSQSAHCVAHVIPAMSRIRRQDAIGLWIGLAL